jgi:acyl carrier protein
MNQSALLGRADRLRELAAAVLEVDPEDVGDHTSFKDELEADSLRVMEIAARLEGEFGIQIPAERLPSIVDLTAMRSLVADCLGTAV